MVVVRGFGYIDGDEKEVKAFKLTIYNSQDKTVPPCLLWFVIRAIIKNIPQTFFEETKIDSIVECTVNNAPDAQRNFLNIVQMD